MITCPACATECPDGSRFCSSCGSPVNAGHGLATERRTITVLFADLVGFTSLTERLDPEDVDRLLREFGALARSAIEAYGGVVEKYIGDAVAGVFGVPKLHEDDAERAVRAGLRLLDRLPGLTTPRGRGSAGRHRHGARVRAPRRHAWLRREFRRRRRRQHRGAPADSTRSDARRHRRAHPRAVRRRHRLRSDGPTVAAKGKAEALRPWVVKAPIARSGVDLRSVFASPLWGARSNWASSRGLFAKTIASREPQFALVTGEAGIGKSRLVVELARHLDETPELLATWRHGRAAAPRRRRRVLVARRDRAPAGRRARERRSADRGRQAASGGARRA